MARKNRITAQVTNKQQTKLLEFYGLDAIINHFMTDPRIKSAYHHLEVLHSRQFQQTMPLVSRQSKEPFFKSYEEFANILRDHLRTEGTTFILEEYVQAPHNITLVKRHIKSKAPQYFEQVLSRAMENLSSQLRQAKIDNGQQTNPWL